MPKRKRDEEDTGRPRSKHANAHRQLQTEVANAHKQLQRAFKLAKGFERQKLGRRRKSAAQQKDQSQTTKVDSELEAWKHLEPGFLAAIHLQRLVQREKALRESERLVSLCQTEKKIPSELASANVSARLFNANPVKAAVTESLSAIRAALGLHEESRKSSSSKDNPKQKSQRHQVDLSDDEDEAASVPDEEASTDEHSEDEFEDAEDDFEELANGRLASESGSDVSLDLDALKASREYKPQRDLSVTPPGSDEESNSIGSDIPDPDDNDADTEEDAPSDSDSDEPPLDPPTKKNPKEPPTPAPKPGESNFMTTLSMGGYISGSESEASSLEEQLAPRKNRRGQRARQAIWEQKYGKKAKHLQDERGGRKGRDAGWDARKGATGGGGARGKEPWRPGWARDKERGGHASAANATAVMPGRNFGGQTKPKAAAGDNKPLHPSWDAKLKAKQKNEAGSAKFAGKKVTFD